MKDRPGTLHWMLWWNCLVRNARSSQNLISSLIWTKRGKKDSLLSCKQHYQLPFVGLSLPLLNVKVFKKSCFGSALFTETICRCVLNQNNIIYYSGSLCCLRKCETFTSLQKALSEQLWRLTGLTCQRWRQKEQQTPVAPHLVLCVQLCANTEIMSLRSGQPKVRSVLWCIHRFCFPPPRIQI